MYSDDSDKNCNTKSCRKEKQKLGKAQYVDKQLLDEYIEKSGYRIGFIVDTMGISWEAFNRKHKGLTPFRGSEVYVLCSILNISDADKPKIFCASACKK